LRDNEIAKYINIKDGTLIEEEEEEEEATEEEPETGEFAINEEPLKS